MEIELNGQTYRIGKLNAMTQFHVSRRIAPLIPTLVPVFVQLSKEGLAGDLGRFGEALGPFAEGISEMDDAASEYVLSNCLSVVHRQNGQGWAPIWSKAHNACMFEDIDLSVMLNLAVRVIQDSLAPFIKGLLTSQQGSPGKPA